MDVYNKELQKLIDKAKSKGYQFVNGEFIKSNEEEIVVMHISINTLGSGERFLHFQLYDKMFILSEEELNKVKQIKNKDDIIEFLSELELDNDYNYFEVVENIEPEQFFYLDYFQELQETYHHETYLVARFHLENFEEAGFIEVFKCSRDLFEKHNNIFNHTKSYLIE